MSSAEESSPDVSGTGVSGTGESATGTSSTEAKLRQYLKRVTVDLGQARRRLREVEERAQEPIAIVSMACRFPGDTRTPEALWDLVAEGGDAIDDFPTNRGWDLESLYHPDPDHPGTSYVRRGGFLYDAPAFDASFFGISPREALAMDPQQRVLMETAWQLLERAGIDPASLKLSATGVYIGAGVLGFGGAQPDKTVEGHLLTGSALSVLSGRISFTLGLEGPSVSVDTACSSSLVSMHLAAQALRQGECDLALAGGVTVMSTPGAFTEFSRQGALSPDGRSKAFAASADGTGFSEGAGLLLLERLSDARRNGHKVLAVIRGSAVNQDGASNGLTAPNGPSQERVIRAALANAGLGAAEVDAVEAHGTGTKLGDPIEAGALLATYGRDRDEDRPLWLGSVKSNIGHPQGAAGVAGVIKMVMALQRELLPATLYVDEPTPHVDWSSGSVRLLTEPVPWTRGERPRRAGVSAFGMSGTNAHVILEEAPPEEAAAAETPAEGTGAVVPWVVSGRGEEALRAQAAQLAEHVRDDDQRPASPLEVGWSLATTRSVFENRAVVVGDDRDALLDGLRSLAAGEASPDVVSGAVGPTGPGPVMVFPGQGGQWVGMGARLLDESPVFAARIAECEQALSAYVDWSLTDVLRGDGSELARIDVVQPVLWAVMVALAAVWADQGIEPAAVVGHSQGEIAAACVVGAISLDEAARIVAVRSVLLRQLSGRGGMASLGMGQEQAADLIDGHPGVVVAAVNGPSSTVISGPPEGIAAVVADAQERGLRARAVASDVAGHGPQLDAILDQLTEGLAGIRPAATDVAFYSTVTAGHLTDTTELDTAYWVRNVRRTVRFADTIDALLADGYRLFIEVSPHPVLNLALEGLIERAAVPATVVPTLRRDHGDTTQLARAAAHAFAAGADVDWRRWFPADPAPRTVDLPTYAFQRQDFWPAPAGGRSGDPAGLGLAASGHPLLGASVGLASGDVHLLSGRVSRQSAAWLDDHVVAGQALVPGAAQVEWVLRAGDDAGCSALEELTLQTPLVLPDTGGLRIQVVVEAADAHGRRDVRLFSRPDDDDAFASTHPWTCHATGVLAPAPTDGTNGTRDAADTLDGAWPPADAEPVPADDLYAQADRTGYGYGPAFRGVRALWRHGKDVLAEVTLPKEAGDPDGFGIHPALLDAVLQPAALLLPPTDAEQVWLPFAWNDVALHAVRATTVRVRLTPLGERIDQGLRITVADAVGAPVLTVRDLRSRPTDTGRLAAAATRDRHGLFDLEWIAPENAAENAAGPARDASEGWVTLGEDAASLADLLASVEAGAPAPQLVAAPVEPDRTDDGLALATHVLDLVQTWLASPLHDSRLVLVTRGAVTDADVDVAAAAVWGLVRSAQSEHPGRFTLIDLGPDDTLAAAMQAAHLEEPQLAVHGGEIRVPRLVRATTDPTAPNGTPEADRTADPSEGLHRNGTVLITGGTGVLGRLVAEHLVTEWGVRHLLLASRRGDQAPGSAELRARLSELGASVEIAPADVGDAEAVAALIASVDPAHPLTGVIHAAGVLDDAVITAQTPESLARVWATKATAARHLHEATRETPLDFFVVFSSAAASLGSPGQANYAAANAYCDALVQHRRAQGLAGLSIAWGLWQATSGMTGQLSETDLARMKRTGFAALTDEGGLALLDAARAHDRAYVVAADLDPRAVTDGLSPLLRALTAPATRRRVASEGLADGALATRLAGLDADGRLRLLTDVVREYVAAVLGHGSAARVGVDIAFKDLGFDSLTAVELRNRLSAACDVRLPATLIFDHPTPQALATHLVDRLAGSTSATTTVNATAPAAAHVAAGADVDADTDDPVAIVAMTCRFPGGVASPDDLWDLLDARKDAMGAFPTDRGWDLERLFHPDPDHPGTSYTDQGGFLPDAGDFDAAFFGINPREALAMDPQQRLLLEASWEVLERAGIDPTTLKGTPTGTYVGLMYHDYAKSFPTADAQLEGYSYLASTGSMVSGRVAYTLGLEGPAVTVDTACSSSLVSIHLATQALRHGECDLALAGGVTVMADPDMFAGFSRQRGLSPDGRCKAYAAAADGVGFSEGVGVLLLERLSDARRHGRRVLGVVRGSAVNQDGASNGLTAPNGPSQERVIRQALASGGLSSVDVDVVEGHGTGTTLGDPIEAQALLATYGQGRPEDRPLWLGSVKSNIGHTQAAAGVAGVIKMVMAMRHGVVPASLHVDVPSPHVEWDSGAVRLAVESVPWPQVEGRPRRAGVSSFGASGTNAHVIVESVPDGLEEDSVSVGGEALETETDGRLVPWVVSARSPQALRDQALRLRDFASDASFRAPLADVGWSLLKTRALHEHRAVVVGAERAELIAALEALATGEPHAALVGPACSQARVGGDDVVWLFSGQGSQLVGMGAGLYERFPVFAAAFDEVCGLLEGPLGVEAGGLREVVFRGPRERLDHTVWAQAGLFALQVGLARLWESVGVRPDVVLGHSIGEIAAAHVAGVFDLADACRVVGARARLMGGLPEGGAMCAVQATPAELAADVDGSAVSVAAVNTPDSTVISGPSDEVDRIAGVWRERGRKTKALSVSHAFHSALMEPMLAEFTEAIRGVKFRQPSIPLMSNVSGERAGEEITDPEYWARHVRNAVLFQPAIAQVADSAGVFVELGPAPVLTTAAQHTLDESDSQESVLVASLAGERPEESAFVEAMARLHTAGVAVDWSVLFAGDRVPGLVELPTYAFQRERFWLSGRSGGGDAATLGLVAAGHPLLGAAVEFADRGGCLLTGRLSRSGVSWLADHVVAGAVLVPGAALVEWALRAGDEVGCVTVEELMLQAPLVVPEASGLRVQVVVEEAGEDGRRGVQIYSRPDADAVGGDDSWICHATGVLSPESARLDTELGGVWPPAGAEPLDVDGFYAQAGEAGYGYGPAFRGLRAVWRHGQDLLAEVVLPEAAGAHDGYGIHPALLDATLHPLLAARFMDGSEDDQLYVPFGWAGVSLRAVGATTVRVRLRPVGESVDQGLSVTVTDATGGPVLSVDSLQTRPVKPSQLAAAQQPDVRGLFTVEWTPLPQTDADGEADWVVLSDGVGRLADVVSAAGGEAPWAVVAPVDASVGDGREGLDGRLVVERVLSLVQEFLALPELAESRLLVVTRGAVATGVDGDGDVDASAAAVWGLVRSAQSENPGRFILLDVDGDGDDQGPDLNGRHLPHATLRHAAEELDEPQLALREGTLYVPRLTQARQSAELVVPPGEPAWRLRMVHDGSLDALAAVACPEALEPLAPGQVRIAVHAAGINFRDVLVALGMVPAYGAMGGEGAGVVTEVGPEVTHVSVGDRVMGVFEGAFGPVVIAEARMVTPVPQGWDMREAAGIPAAFLTAWYGLVELAGLKAGERVLVHAATGGVGMAAVQIARHVGAEVFATASPGKHAVLEEMGIDAAHRASSRDLAFEGTFREATGGRGMDVVLNSLAGEFIDASLRLLGDGGRFLEMGKTDVRAAEEVAAEHADVSYTAYDLVGDAGPDRISNMLDKLVELFASERLKPLPVRSWPLDKAQEAFRFMSQAKHTGKLVLEIPPALDPEGTVLVTGGTGALGQVVAEHLVREWGVRHLLLASRRGPEAPGSDELASKLTGLGAEVTIVAADVSDPASVVELVGKTDPSHPLTGVVHAAGVLEDGVVTAQTPEGLARVWAAKAAAAANLHEATREMRLGLFVVFSSAAATLGSPGQANYAAANAYCDALMQHRRAVGQVGLSVGWGLWEAPDAKPGVAADAKASAATVGKASALSDGTNGSAPQDTTGTAPQGMTGGLTDTDVARMARIGVKGMSNAHGLALFDAAHRHGRPHLVGFNLDLRTLATHPLHTRPALLRGLATPTAGGASRPTATAGGQPADLAGRLAALSPSDRHHTLVRLIREQAATVLGHHPDSLTTGSTFKELGFDSLTAVELRNRLSAATGLRLPAGLVFDHPDADILAEHLGAQLAPDGDTPAGAEATDPVLRDLAKLENALSSTLVEHLDADAVTARLEALLSNWKAASAAPGSGSTKEQLQVATTDQVLDFIDKELGV
uniref:MonAIV n=1 Tax=Streptomyces virginiae TaxID=1961 RepID=Q846X3_STRVG|nr:monensin polyketide synthase modules 5 and 6 [Streptomyces virginiae]ANZ52462.1 MonAIV [Streptomyces virginiae]